MSRYAEGTSVPMDRSRAEAEKTLVRYGAHGFAYAWERRTIVTPRGAHSVYCGVRRGEDRCMHGCPKTIEREVVILGFKMKLDGREREVRLEVPMPHEREFNSRTSTGSKAKADAATRQRWRALVLVLKAKLEAVESGISTLESEFLAGIVMPNGQTLGEYAIPKLSGVLDEGRPLLPASPEA